MFYVYLLKSTDNFYTGFTTDLKRRIIEHNTDKNVATKNKGPWSLIFYEAYLNEQDALRRERYLKTSVGRRMLKRMSKEYLASEGNISTPHFLVAKK